MTHTQLSECSVRAPIRKGREGNGIGREVFGTTSIDLTVGGVESPPEAWMETHSLEDWDPPCEYSVHGTIGSSGPAAWAVYYSPLAACGCPLPPLVLYCDPCWSQRRAGSVYCGACSWVGPAMEDILRVEPLR